MGTAKVLTCEDASFTGSQIHRVVHRMVLGLQNRYWFSKNLARHKDRLHLMKGIVDSTAPKLPTIDKKRAKLGHAQQNIAQRNNENARLVVRLAKVFTSGGNLSAEDLGQDAKTVRQRKASVKNASNVTAKRAELNRITFDNKLIWNRLLDVAPVINFNEEHFHVTNRRHQQCRAETIYYRQKNSPFPVGIEDRPKPRAQSSCQSKRTTSRSKSRRSSVQARPPPSSALPDNLQVTVTSEVEMAGWGDPSTYLDKLSADHLSTCLSFKRPPESVKHLFSTLMVLVSPFDVKFSDVSWFAVQQWVNELCDTETFLENLKIFELSMVPAQNAHNAMRFMQQSGLTSEGLKKVSESLGYLFDWIHALCSSAPAPNEITEDEASAEEEAAAAVDQEVDAEFSQEELDQFDKNQDGQIDGQELEDP